MTPSPGNPEVGDLFCPHCTYNLRGLPDRRCPECGNVFDPATLTASRVPWLNSHSGRIRAWWKTCWLVTRRPADFAASLNAPSPYPAACWFLLVNALIVATPLIGLVLCYLNDLRFILNRWPSMLAYRSPTTPTTPAFVFDLLLPMVCGLSMTPVFLLAIVFTVFATLGWTTHLFQHLPLPPLQRDRAASLSLYSSGIPIVVTLFWAAMAAGLITNYVLITRDADPFGAAWGIMGTCLLFAVPTYLFRLWRMYCHFAPAGVIRRVLTFIAIPAGTICVAALSLLVITWPAGLIRLIWLSLFP